MPRACRRRSSRQPSATRCTRRPRRYRDLLASAGVPVAFRRYEGMIHGYFGLDSVFDVAGEAMADAGSALREGLL